MMIKMEVGLGAEEPAPVDDSKENRNPPKRKKQRAHAERRRRKKAWKQAQKSQSGKKSESA